MTGPLARLGARADVLVGRVAWALRGRFARALLATGAWPRCGERGCASLATQGCSHDRAHLSCDAHAEGWRFCTRFDDLPGVAVVRRAVGGAA